MTDSDADASIDLTGASDYLVSECRLIDFADENLERVTEATVPFARVALDDSNDNEEFDLDNLASMD